jgi:hypothetical protein
LTLPASAQRVSIYDPMLGTTAIATQTSAGTVSFLVADHPVIAEIVQ